MNQSEQLMENASYSWSEDSVRKIITTGAAAKNTMYRKWVILKHFIPILQNEKI